MLISQAHHGKKRETIRGFGIVQEDRYLLKEVAPFRMSKHSQIFNDKTAVIAKSVKLCFYLNTHYFLLPKWYLQDICCIRLN